MLKAIFYLLTGDYRPQNGHARKLRALRARKLRLPPKRGEPLRLLSGGCVLRGSVVMRGQDLGFKVQGLGV